MIGIHIAMTLPGRLSDIIAPTTPVETIQLHITPRMNSASMPAASQSIIPVDTKLAAGITRIFPQFCDRFEAISVRVPTINVTAIDLSVSVSAAVNVAEVNQLLQKAARESFRGIVDYTELPLVSIDFNHDPHSAIVDGTQTRVSGQHLIKTLVWCDNEWGFANRMLDTTRAMAASGF